jgi:hypothetical protein
VNKLLDNIQEFVMTGLGLVALYLVVTHGSQVNTLVKSGFAGLNVTYRTLQGR